MSRVAPVVGVTTTRLDRPSYKRNAGTERSHSELLGDVRALTTG